MSYPVRFSVMTFNVWGTFLWPQRKPSLKSLLTNLCSDIIILQEVTNQILDSIIEVLPNHTFIQDSNTAWSSESNIVWNTTLFEILDYGFMCFNISQYPSRGLFWARFRVKNRNIDEKDITFTVCTCHFPWVGSSIEINNRINLRIECSNVVAQFIQQRKQIYNEPIMVGGDFNEDFHPIRILREVGLIDIFESLDMPAPITHPVRPSDPTEEIRVSNTTSILLLHSLTKYLYLYVYSQIEHLIGY
jgi:hypothetical protein